MGGSRHSGGVQDIVGVDGMDFCDELDNVTTELTDEVGIDLGIRSLFLISRN